MAANACANGHRTGPMDEMVSTHISAASTINPFCNRQHSINISLLALTCSKHRQFGSWTATLKRQCRLNFEWQKFSPNGAICASTALLSSLPLHAVAVILGKRRGCWPSININGTNLYVMAAMVVYLLPRRPTIARRAYKMIRLMSRLPHLSTRPKSRRARKFVRGERSQD
jgi:hypothetical protein